MGGVGCWTWCRLCCPEGHLSIAPACCCTMEKTADSMSLIYFMPASQFLELWKSWLLVYPREVPWEAFWWRVRESVRQLEESLPGCTRQVQHRKNAKSNVFSIFHDWEPIFRAVGVLLVGAPRGSLVGGLLAAGCWLGHPRRSSYTTTTLLHHQKNFISIVAGIFQGCPPIFRGPGVLVAGAPKGSPVRWVGESPTHLKGVFVQHYPDTAT